MGLGRMRILYSAVDTSIPGTHGGSVHALELCRALSCRGHDVYVVAPAPETDDSDMRAGAALDLATAGGQIVRLKRPPRFLEWTAVNDVQRIARKVRPHVLIERFYTFGGAGIWAAHRLGIPSVLEVNSPARPYPRSLRDRIDRLSIVRPVERWRRQQLVWSDAVYATSKHLLPPALQSAVTVVTNGVDVERFRPAADPPEAGGPLRCVYASSFRSWHGTEDLVAAISTCVARGVDLRVTCLGTGPLWNVAHEAARRAGVLDVMEFVGSVPYEKVPWYLARADVGLAPFNPAAFPALRLGWFWSPIKIFEYLAAGLAVVTLGIDELRALLPDSVARFYRPGEVSELADAIEGLASNRTELVQIGKAARSLAESRFTWDHQAAVVETVLRKVTQ